MSIENQKKFLESYARQLKLTNIRHYIDDDESGRFFDRSAYSRMIDLTKVIEQELFRIQKMICAAKANGKDRELFTEVREMFYELQHKVYCVYPECSKKVKQVQRLKHCNSSTIPKKGTQK